MLGKKDLETLDGYKLFEYQDLSVHLIPPQVFKLIEERVGAIREATYSQHLASSGKIIDLDQRDMSYDHLIMISRTDTTLAGAARMQMIPGKRENFLENELPGSGESYLEHVYPGIKRALYQQANHIEIGRVVITDSFQKRPHSLMCLFRGALLIAKNSGYDHLFGLVSYNHFKYNNVTNSKFFNELMQDRFWVSDCMLPPARYPAEFTEEISNMEKCLSIKELETTISTKYDRGFKIPVLLKHYISLMEARVAGLSIARDFNQITEILVTSNLRRVPKSRINYFVDIKHDPVYRKFKWFRG